MIFLNTPRLVLRNVSEKDIPIIFDYRNHPACARYQRGQTKDLPGITALVQRRQNDALSAENNCMVAVALRDTDEMVGEIIVMPNEGTISLGYTFSYRYHRKGFAFEALSSLIAHLHADYPERDFISFVEPENAASIGLLKKLGYRDLGYLPAITSQAFGLYTTPVTEKEISEAIAKQ